MVACSLREARRGFAVMSVLARRRRLISAARSDVVHERTSRGSGAGGGRASAKGRAAAHVRARTGDRFRDVRIGVRARRDRALCFALTTGALDSRSSARERAGTHE